MVNEFGWSRAHTSFAFSIFMFVYSFATIPMGWLFDRFGPRIPLYFSTLLIGVGFPLCSLTAHLWQLWIFFGLIAGTGHGAAYVVPLSTLVRWFIDRRGLAVGIVGAGIGAGVSVVPPVAERLISAYGWRTTFIVLGLIYALIHLIGAITLRKNPEEMGLKPYGTHAPGIDTPSSQDIVSAPAAETDLTFWEAIKTRSFWMLYFGILFAFASETLAAVHVVPFAQDMGITPSMAARSMATLGIGSMLGKIIMGALSDRIGRKRTLGMAYLLQGIMMFCLVGTRNSTTLYIVMAIVGLSYGGWSAVFAPLTGEYFGLSHMGKILAAAMTCGAFSGILGPFLAGYLFDVTGSYQWAFSIAGFICLVAFSLSFLVKPALKKSGAPTPR
jgi:OFA family oxalate/formate antiporter-like MFS transporter